MTSLRPGSVNSVAQWPVHQRPPRNGVPGCGLWWTAMLWCPMSQTPEKPHPQRWAVKPVRSLRERHWGWMVNPMRVSWPTPRREQRRLLPQDRLCASSTCP
jgi:hypothetical protein